MATSCNHGEGSSFLSLPTKRNVGFHEPRVPTNNQSQHTIVDFKSKLLPRIIAVCQPPSSGQPPSIAGARETGVVSASQEDLIRKGPLVPSEQQWYTLNQLRIHAGAPERTERGINRLLQYYAQLCWLEERFPFDTHQMANNGSLMFTWFEAFSPKKQGIFTVDHNNFSIKHNIVTTSCLQYEKAAVMWNVGAIYSQMAANQSLWTAEGLRLASQYFLRASGAFLHCRDTLYPRYTCKLDSVSSDLSEETLKAASDLMLAQTMECYYHKADFDHTSSPVTSQIATQTADYYDIAYKAAKLNCSFVKSRFPKFWPSQMRLKMMIYTALGHLHCPNSMSPDVSVGERQSRLRLAMTHITAAIEKHTALNHPTMAGTAVGFLNNAAGVKTAADLSIPTISGHLEALLTSTYDQISKALSEVDEANYAKFHQTVVKTHDLAPLKRPITSLISKFDIINGGIGSGSIIDRINDGRISDVFEGVVGMLLLRSGFASGLTLLDNPPLSGLEEGLVVPGNSGGVHSGVATHRGSVQSLVDGDGKPPIQLPFGAAARHRQLDAGRAQQRASLSSSQPAAIQQSPTSPSRRPSAAGVSLPTPVVDEIRKFIWEVKETRDYCANRLKSISGQLNNIIPSGTMLPIDPSFTSTDEAKQFSAQQRAVTKRSVGLLRQYKDISKLNQLHPTHRLVTSLSESHDFISAYLVKVHQTVFDDQTVLRARLQKLAFDTSGGDPDAPQSSVNNLLALRALCKSLVDHWFQSSSGDEQITITLLKPPSDSGDVEFPVESFAKHRRATLDLLRLAKEETFAELFAIGAPREQDANYDDGEEMMEHQLHWSTSKIRTVIPCLTDQYGHLYQAALDTVLKIIRSLLIILSQQSNAATAQISGNVHELLPEMLTAFGEFSRRVQALKQTAENNTSDVEKLFAQWYGQEISVAASWAQQGRNKVVDGLLAAGSEHSGLHSESAAPDMLICRGIEAIRRQLQLAKESTADLEKAVAEIEIALPFPNVDAEVQELLVNVAKLRQMDIESDGIVTVFDEQFSKWRRWHDLAIGQQQKMLEIKAHLLDKFSSWVTESAITLPDKSSLAAIDSDSFEDCDDSNAAGFSREDSVLMDDLIRKQNDLLSEQQSNADRLAEVAIAAMNRRSSAAPIQQQQQQQKSNRRRPAAHGQHRAQMMRNLSLTAAAIQKQSRSIDLDLKQSVPLQALEAKYHELYEQMQLLQEQQREFLSGGQSGSAKHKAENTHAAGSPSRRESILSQAKDKLISILKTVAGENSSSAGQRPVVMTSVQRSSFAQPAPPMPQFRQQSSFHAPRFVEPSAPALPEGVGMAARRKPVNYEAIMIADKYPQQQQQQRRSSMKKRHSVVSPVRFEEAPQQNNDYRRPSGVSRQGRRNYSNETDLTDFYQQRPTNGMRGGMVTTTDVPPHRRNTFLDIHHHQQQQSYPADNVKLKQKQGMPQTSQEAIEQITRYCASMRQGSVHGGVEQLIP